MESYFASVSLAKFLFKIKLNLIGTVRHNKYEINRKKEVYLNKFAFDKFLTLVSYLSKVNLLCWEIAVK